MGPVLLHDDVIAEYRDFATYAAGDSPCFEAWASAVAEDPEVLAWLATLPPRKRQPNLVLAAARWHGAPAPGPYDGLRRVLLEQEPEVRATVRSRATQTNEVGRLASLVPVMSLVEGPLALVEVGASAGLCLYPDRYDYAWPPLGGLRGSGGPVLTAVASGPLPVPTAHPEVAWRERGRPPPPRRGRPGRDGVAGEPGVARAGRPTRAGCARPSRSPPRTRRRCARGDLLDHLPGLVEEAAAHGTPVVFHSAVIAYLEPAGRRLFHDLVGRPRGGGSLPLDQQRGADGAAGRDRVAARPPGPVRHRARRSPGGLQPRSRPRRGLAALRWWRVVSVGSGTLT